jgi:hypothetical protein
MSGQFKSTTGLARTSIWLDPRQTERLRILGRVKGLRPAPLIRLIISEYLAENAHVIKALKKQIPKPKTKTKILKRLPAWKKLELIQAIETKAATKSADEFVKKVLA